jgi:hypothetical protein
MGARALQVTECLRGFLASPKEWGSKKRMEHGKAPPEWFLCAFPDLTTSGLEVADRRLSPGNFSVLNARDTVSTNP